MKDKIQAIIITIQKDQNIKGLMYSEIQINKLLNFIQRLYIITNNVIKTLEFCSLRQLDLSIITYDNLINITKKANILEDIETIHTTCTLINDQIHIFLAIPKYSNIKYELQQFTPIPCIHNNAYYSLLKSNNLYTKYNNKNIIINKYISNKYCKSNINQINKCMNNIINIKHKHNYPDNVIPTTNTISQIPFTNKILIFDCKDKHLYKQIKGIYLNNENISKIQDTTFEKYNNLNTEIIFEEFTTEQISTIPQIKEIKLNRIRSEQIKPINLNKWDHHMYSIYTILIIITTIIIVLLFKNKIFLCFKKCRQNKYVITGKQELELETQINPLV